MKFHISLTLAIVFFAAALVPATEGFHAKVQDYLVGNCKIWVTDLKGNYVAGDKNFHPCGDRKTLDIDTQSKDKYILRAATIGEVDTKSRGPFKADTCYIIEGSSEVWSLELAEHCYN